LAESPDADASPRCHVDRSDGRAENLHPSFVV
jgi:hypothetical protein